MLVSFSVQNYRSFASEQTISMVAGTSARRKKRFSFPSGNSVAPDLLRSVCLFGPNGAGKSSLVGAFAFFQEFVVLSAKDMQEGDEIDVTPFLLDEACRDRPTEFEATFIHGDALYQYGFAVDTERVWSEWLFSKSNTLGTNFRTLFQREYDVTKKEYVWNISKTNVKGAKELWKKSTRNNALFLSTAIQQNAAAFKEPFDWIRKYLRVVLSPEGLLPSFTINQCEDQVRKKKILGILQSVDIRIEDIEFDFQEVARDKLPSEFLKFAPEEFKNSRAPVKSVHIKSYHKDSGGNLIALDFSEESDGSHVVFNIAGPWLDVLENGYTLVVDELHNSLHPHALKYLVNLFHDPKINQNGAQLIFTSHETSVMTKEFMHQDQVWLVENYDAEGSKLIPLSDYKVRDVSTFQKAYLDGRYGAVPKLKEFVDA